MIFQSIEDLREDLSFYDVLGEINGMSSYVAETITDLSFERRIMMRDESAKERYST